MSCDYLGQLIDLYLAKIHYFIPPGMLCAWQQYFCLPAVCSASCPWDVVLACDSDDRAGVTLVLVVVYPCEPDGRAVVLAVTLF